ncbi:hypothetical protein SAMN03159496_06184 [Rhizobium sp. NFR07]|nr:hypothetical protein SAMN03159496_06184 [Rhizobium sp. NFR07]
MTRQFESIRPMIDHRQKAIFFAENAEDIPQDMWKDYDLSEVLLDEWSNIAEIKCEIARSNYTWGIEAARFPGRDRRIRGCFLKLMAVTTEHPNTSW